MCLHGRTEQSAKLAKSSVESREQPAHQSGSLEQLWDYCGWWVVAIQQMTAHDFLELDGMPPEKAVHNHMANISAYAQFDWFEYVWYIDQSEDTT
jgi:hypothetical protein